MHSIYIYIYVYERSRYRGYYEYGKPSDVCTAGGTSKYEWYEYIMK